MNDQSPTNATETACQPYDCSTFSTFHGSDRAVRDTKCYRRFRESLRMFRARFRANFPRLSPEFPTDNAEFLSPPGIPPGELLPLRSGRES